MDPGSHRAFYKMGRSHPFEEGHQSDCFKLHLGAHYHMIWDPQQTEQQQRYPVCKKGHEEPDEGIK